MLFNDSTLRSFNDAIVPGSLGSEKILCFFHSGALFSRSQRDGREWRPHVLSRCASDSSEPLPVLSSPWRDCTVSSDHLRAGKKLGCSHACRCGCPQDAALVCRPLLRQVFKRPFAFVEGTRSY